MRHREIKIYIDGVLVAKLRSDKPLHDCITSFVKTRRVIGIHLDGRRVKCADDRGHEAEQLVAPRFTVRCPSDL